MRDTDLDQPNASRARCSEAIHLVLPYPVSANRYWRHGLIKGRPVTFVTKEAKAYREDVGWKARAQGLRTPSSERIEIALVLYPARPKDWAKRKAKNPDRWDDSVQCMDLGNCEKVVGDALNGIAWVDDKQIFRMVKHRAEPDEHGARLELYIRPAARSMDLFGPDLMELRR